MNKKEADEIGEFVGNIMLGILAISLWGLALVIIVKVAIYIWSL